jgi:hypothetical protein
VTDDDGAATFVTVFPGWYSGRAVHIHFKVRTGELEFTSQLFFEESDIAAVMAKSAYSSRGNPDTDNDEDSIYGSDGSELTVDLAGDGAGGLAGTFTVGLSGLPDDDAVAVKLKHRRFRRTDGGRRILRLTVDADEQVALRARISRSGRRLARKRFPAVATGTHKLNVPIPKHVRAGVARLTLFVQDASGNTKIIRRTVRVPRRRL